MRDSYKYRANIVEYELEKFESESGEVEEIQIYNEAMPEEDDRSLSRASQSKSASMGGVQHNIVINQQETSLEKVSSASERVEYGEEVPASEIDQMLDKDIQSFNTLQHPE